MTPSRETKVPATNLRIVVCLRVQSSCAEGPFERATFAHKQSEGGQEAALGTGTVARRERAASYFLV